MDITIKQTALLGTEKSKLNISQITEEIAALLTTISNEEEKLLHAIIYDEYYELAGNKPFKINIENYPESAIIEQKKIAPKEYLAVFYNLDTIEQNKVFYFKKWLVPLLNKEFIVNNELIIAMLNQYTTYPNGIKKLINEVIGNIGTTMLANFSELNYKAEETLLANKWAEYSFTQQKLFIESLILTKPSEAVSLMESTWQTESITNKKTFLKILALNPNSSCFAFVEKLYKTEFAYQAKEKKTEKECRGLCVEILFKDINNPIYDQLKIHLSPYLKEKKGLLGWVTGKNEKELNLPLDDDTSFWNEAFFIQHFGEDDAGFLTGAFLHKNQFRFAYLVANVKIEFWNTLFQSNTEEVVKWLLQAPSLKVGKEAKSVLMNALLSNCLAFKDKDLANQVVKVVDIPFLKEITHLLSQNDYEKTMMNADLALHIDILKNNPLLENEYFSEKFSTWLLQKWAQHIQNENYPNYELAKQIKHLLPTTIENVLYELNMQMSTSTKVEFWNKHYFVPLKQHIDFIKQLEIQTKLL